MPALKKELEETRKLLWLALKEAGGARRTVTVQRGDLPADYDIEVRERKEIGWTIITARTK